MKDNPDMAIVHGTLAVRDARHNEISKLHRLKNQLVVYTSEQKF